jgi:hypothetical protein
MQSTLLFLLMFALNLVPEDVVRFSMEVEEGEVLHFEKQEDGSWVSPEISEEAKVSFLAKGMTMTINAEGETQTVDLGKELGFKGGIDWDTVKETKMGDMTFKINRLEGGFDLQVEGIGDKIQTPKVRWLKADLK